MNVSKCLYTDVWQGKSLGPKFGRVDVVDGSVNNNNDDDDKSEGVS